MKEEEDLDSAYTQVQILLHLHVQCIWNSSFYKLETTT